MDRKINQKGGNSMSAPKVKNLIILILLLVNIFLLALVVPSRTSAELHDQTSARQLSQLFEANGIRLNAAMIPRTETLYDQTLTSDPQAASAAVLALLGESAASSQQDGGLYFSSPLGEAMLVNGSLTAEVNIPAANPEVFTRDCLARMGLTVRAVTTTGRLETVTVCRAETDVGGLPVVSNRLTFRYENGTLTRVEGLILTGQDTLEITGTQSCISAADALVDFLGSRLSTGWLGSSIDSMEQGWSLTRGAGASFSLRPVWRLYTDAGVCLVNGITGAVTLQ